MGTLLLRAGRLVMRAGRFVYTTCAECCNIKCVLYWQADPCLSAPGGDPSGFCGEPTTTEPPVPPPPVYVPKEAICFGRPVQPGDTIEVEGRCYTVTNILFRTITSNCPYPPLPPDARVLDGAPCIRETCADHRCNMNTGGLAIASSCEPGATGGFPPVVFCRNTISQCTYLPMLMSDGRVHCYHLDPGVGGSPNMPVPAIFLGDVSHVPILKSCCECQSDPEHGDPGSPCLTCAPVTIVYSGVPGSQTVSTFGQPCCVDTRAPCSVSFQWLSQVKYANNQLKEEFRADKQTLPCGGSQSPIVRHREWTEDGTLVTDFTFPLGGAVESNCPRFSLSPPQISEGVPWQYSQDCNSVRFSLSATIGDLSISDNVTLIVTRGSGTPPCVGNCGGTGFAGIAIPPEQWPDWATFIGDDRRPGESGVGDTFARQLGKSGETFKAAFRRVFGKDCGCTARQDRWNILYPYA